ncbi:HlyD family efflux transporter periplasmic adaptor subunit [Acetivibrio clariflavus]|uniref:HlyD family efflux transporter periplasmic adaptor subunit n=1 Tax=Acetivibrio clariflavus TaxID=288965 RepID=UPI000489085A|nr:HlyD family efflux transporter periplasmic adaptor subunit [Acetivibrio clariflavus]
MKIYIQNINDLTDSREMLEAKPHFFMTCFIYIVLAIIAVALTWAYFGEIDNYVKATGSVRPGDTISTIRNSVTGYVEINNLEEGKKVKKGDVLYSIGIDKILAEKTVYENQIKRLETENKNLIKFKQSIMENKNLFDSKNIDEADYYNRYQQYEISRTVSNEEYTNQRLDTEQLKNEMELSLKSAQINYKKVSDTLEKLKLLEESIKVGKNLFDESEVEFFNRYNDYELNVKQLEMKKQQCADNYSSLKKLYELDAISKQELETAKNEMDFATLNLDKYKNEYMMNLKASITQNEQSIDEVSVSMEKAKSVLKKLNDKGQNPEIKMEKMKIDTLVQIEDALIANQNNLDQARSAIKKLEMTIEEATVKAPIDGTINLYVEISKGDYLQSGVEIAAIVPDTATQYKVQLMVNNKDIAEVKEGQRIKYRFLALPYSEYGEADGTVKKISTDARIDSENGVSYYIVEATLDNHEMKSYKGEVKEIKSGMVCEAQVVTGSKKILYWLLEKIDLID